MCMPPTFPTTPLILTNDLANVLPLHSHAYSQTNPEATKVPIVPTPVILVPPPAMISLPEAKNGVIRNEDFAFWTNTSNILEEDLGLIEAEDTVLSCAQTHPQIELISLPPALISLPEAENGVIGNEDLANRMNSHDILENDLGLIEAKDAVSSCVQTHPQIELISPPLSSAPKCDLNSPVIITQHELLTNTPNPEAVIDITTISKEKQVKSHCDINIKCSLSPTPSPSVKSYAFNHHYISFDPNTNAPSTVFISSSSTHSKVSNEYEEVTQPCIDILPWEVSNFKKYFKGASNFIITTPSHKNSQVTCELSSKLSKDFKDSPIPPTTYLPHSIIPFPS
ncbi:hypothetical protein BDQ17DRAFT_1431349 [Cyathus striatus]|nr:hypothetical protein BDQ17DRAFT_1431349 [Cyathus striatus]